MSLTVPPAKNYQSPITAIPTKFGREPPEGRQQIPLSFNWTVDGAQNGSTNQYAVHVNLNQSSTVQFSQVAAVKVDNSQSGSDIQLIFTDTQEIITVGAYEPLSIVPVLTNSREFYAVALGASTGDVTRVQLLNFVPPPVSISQTEEQYFGVTTYMAMNNSNSSVTLAPAGVNGTLEFLQLSYFLTTPPTASALGLIFLEDGNTNYLMNTFEVFADPAQPRVSGNIIIDLQQIRWRFRNGLTLSWNPSTSWAGASQGSNVTWGYRTP